MATKNDSRLRKGKTTPSITFNRWLFEQVVEELPDEPAREVHHLIDELNAREAQAPAPGQIEVRLSRMPLEFIVALSQSSQFLGRDKQVVADYLPGVLKTFKSVWDLGAELVAKPRDLTTTLGFYLKEADRRGDKFILEAKVCDFWTPFLAVHRYFRGFVDEYFAIYANFQIGEIRHMASYYISSEQFEEGAISIQDLLAKMGLRFASKEAIDNYRSKLRKASELSKASGRLMVTEASGFDTANLFHTSRMHRVPLGRPGSPAKVIVETNLESEAVHDYEGVSPDVPAGDKQAALPLVRVFSLSDKKFIYADVDDLKPYQFEEGVIEKLVLPAKTLSVLQKVFEVDRNKVFGDLIRGKHGGIVILAEGPSGAGKTLTAEVFAEHTKRPLYSMEVGELGTAIGSIESNLSDIFRRAEAWNAVLLLDEADIFMMERGDDLERSAIVGVFLRLLDYYPGHLFLTSNRASKIDPAFASRISLKIPYEPFTTERRKAVWELILRAAKLEVTDWDHHADDHLLGGNGVAAVALNGRQIRNVVRLTRILHPDGPVTCADLRDAMDYVAR